MALLFGPFCKHSIFQLHPRDTKTGDAPRHWRWRGFITDYYTAESVLQENPSAGNPTAASQEGLQASASKQPKANPYPQYAPTPPQSPSPPYRSTSNIASLVRSRCASSFFILCHAIFRVSTISICPQYPCVYNIHVSTISMDIYGYCGHMDVVDTCILWTHAYCGQQ